MSTFFLVHGGGHGAWCWYKVIPRLKNSGHRVVAPDSAALGIDRTPASDVTLDRWVEDVCETLDSLPEPVVLVGHSRGGIVISQVAERRPSKVSSLVYVSAMLLQDGESAMAIVQNDGSSLMLPNSEMSEDGASVSIRPDSLRAVFYERSSDEDIALAEVLLRPDPLKPLVTPLELTKGAFGSVPRLYVECLQDNAVPIGLQRRMHGDLPCERVHSINTDHAPFFSQPEQLVSILLEAASVRT